MSRTRIACNILSLPPEILNQIATHLDIVSKLRLGWTCIAFRSVVKNPLLWSDFWWVSNGQYRNFMHMELALEIHKMSVRKLSLTYWCKNDPVHRIFPVIHDCQYLQSLTLTNFYFEARDIVPLLDQVPTLSELHIHSLIPTNIRIPPRRQTSDLNILSVYEKHPFKTWAGSRYFPSDVRVILPDRLFLKDHSRARYLNKHVMNKYYKPRHTIFRNEACLTFYQPLLKYVSIPRVPIAQIYFSPPSMKPTVYRFHKNRHMYQLLVIEDGLGSNNLFGAASFPYRIFNEAILNVPSTTLTSVTLFKETKLNGNDLQAIATVCPNLIHLDISFSDQCLLNLNGLQAVAFSCMKLESLYMDAKNDRQPINYDALWGVIRAMGNLKVLKVSIHLIPSTLGANSLPSLEALCLLYTLEMFPFRFDDTYFDFFNDLPSLRYLRLESIPPIRVNYGLYNCLNTFTSLTNLYICKCNGGRLTLPLVATCYRNLENLYLECDNFILSDTLAVTISQCKKLKILALKVKYLSVVAVRTMFYSLPLLVIFFFM